MVDYIFRRLENLVTSKFIVFLRIVEMKSGAKNALPIEQNRESRRKGRDSPKGFPLQQRRFGYSVLQE